ncbi:MAG: O-antigen ligase family protein [Anaerolineae bacterium]|nr:O-antigen ligase family protein [Anaerolineae bacterium]
MNSETKVAAFCSKVIEAGWLAALVIVPLFFNVYSSRVFEPDKISTLRSIALVIALAWVVKTVEQGVRLESAEDDPESSWLKRLWRRLSQTPLVMPALVLVLVYLISTVFSVAPRVSLLGSYQRLQGTYSTFSYILIFAMMLLEMRSKAQIERLVTTVLLTSVPIALYGILQHYGLDPLPWGGDVRERVAANMGNAIFVAAYLIMALPLALYRTVETFTRILSAEKTNWVDIVLGATYVFILAIQAICIFFTQSRGPWLGLIGGLFFFFLVLAVVRRWRWLVWATVALVVFLAAFLVLFNLPQTPLEGLKSVPYLGRLGHVLDKEEGTSKVRLLIWQGAVEMMLPHEPIQEPDGSNDWMNWARPFIGYGPESMYVAYNRFYPPDLAHVEKRNASPDRSHNETFDSLVITGLIGFVIYMWLFASVFYYGFHWLGVISGKGQTWFFVGCWIGGGLFGALLMGFWQGVEFVGVGLPAGVAAGLGLYLVVWGLFLSGTSGAKKAQTTNPYRLLVVALVSAVLAHFVEIHFGIAIGATRTYFWTYAGLLAVVGYMLPRQWQLEAATTAQSLEPESGTSRRQRRKGGRRQARPSARRGISGWEAVLPYALVLALILCTMAFNFVQNQKQSDSPQQVLWTALTQRKADGGWIPSYGVLEMVLITWLLGGLVIVLEWMRQRDPGPNELNWRMLLGMCLSVSLVISFLFALVLAGRLASVVGQNQLIQVTQLVLGMMTNYYLMVGVLLMLLAFALFREMPLPSVPWRAMAIWAYPVALIVVVLLAVNTNLQVVHADMIYKQAEPYATPGYWDFNIILHQKALALAPQEDFYYLFLGRGFLEKARSAAVAERLSHTFKVSEILQLTPQQLTELSRGDLLNCSDAVLIEAQRINPLNTDHAANLGRLYRTRAEFESDAAHKQAYFDKALDYYGQATMLSPNAAHLFDEWGLVYFMMGQYEQAIAKYEYSLTIDQLYVNTYLSLGDAYMATKAYDQAERAYLGALALDPNQPLVYTQLSYMYGIQGRTDDAISATLKVLEQSPDQQLTYNGYKNLALYYQQGGQIEPAMRAAESALALAPESERDAVQGLITQLQQGGVAPETDILAQQYLVEGEAALNSNQWAQAEAAYLSALNLNPNLLVAHSALAYIYALQGRLEEAERENQTVLSVMPGDFATLKNLAIIYRDLKRYDDALNYAQQALLSPQATEIDKQQLQVFIGEVQSSKAN